MAKRGVHRDRAFWETTVEEWQESGKSQTAFARQRGLKQTTLGNWIKRLGQKKEELGPLRPELIEIVPTRVEPVRTIGPARLHVGAATLEFSTLPPVQYMSLLVREVSSC
jgi:hypothetical protein